MARRLRLTRLAWPALALLLAAAALALRGAVTAQWDWQPGLALAQPWRAWTAAAVHFSPMHLHADLAGCAVVAAFGVAARCGLRATLAWALAWPLTQAGLLIEPGLAHYGGLSGVLHAGVAVAACQVLAGRGARRWVGAAVLAGLAAKLLFETPWRGPLRILPGWDIPIAPLAHATGAAAGLLCALALRIWPARIGR